MKSRAVRRISQGGPGKRPGRDFDIPEVRTGPFFPLLIVLSVAIHAAVLMFLGYFPGFEDRRRDVEVFSVTLSALPGPAGGGGESAEAVKPPDEPVKKPPPEKEAVKAEAKPVEQKPAQKPADPVQEAEIPDAPMGPGQGPAGGGGKKGMTRGPMTLEGGVEFPFGFYLDAVQQKVERNWDPPSLRKNSLPRVVVFFRVDRAGRISDVNVETSSGIELFDQKAVVAVRRSMPLPPLPAGFKGDSLGVHYIFVPEG